MPPAAARCRCEPLSRAVTTRLCRNTLLSIPRVAYQVVLEGRHSALNLLQRLSESAHAAVGASCVKAYIDGCERLGPTTTRNALSEKLSLAMGQVFQSRAALDAAPEDRAARVSSDSAGRALKMALHDVYLHAIDRE